MKYNSTKIQLNATKDKKESLEQKNEKVKRTLEMLMASGAKLGNRKGAILLPLTKSQREQLNPPD